MKIVVLCLMLIFQCIMTNAQKVVYSQPDREDARQTDFEIIGKVGGNILIYKTYNNNHFISVLDMEMKQKDRIKLDFLPDRIINADFISYPGFCYMFYQFQKKNIVYAMSARFDGNGKMLGKEILMDTTQISFLANNKLYSVVNSDDKQHINLFKINSKNDDRFVVTTMLYDKNMVQKEKVPLYVDMPDRHDFLTEFLVDNDGGFAFLRAAQESENDKVKSLFVYTKKAGSNVASSHGIELNKLWLDEVRLKADNYNRHYLVSSFFSKTRRGNIDGLYTCIWDNATDSLLFATSTIFSDNLRNEAKGDNGTKTAFNDFMIRNVIVKKDGGFILAAESFFSTSRGGVNRYDYMYGSPFLRPMDYYSFAPLNYSYPWSRYNSLGQNIRYNAQNIAVFSYDNTGQVNWTNILTKSQFDDDSEAYIGYSLLNSGDQLYFLFNQLEHRLQLLAAQSIDPNGKVTRNPTLKNLDQGYDFMARYGKQIGLHQIIFPCMYRNYLCFARVDF